MASRVDLAAAPYERHCRSDFVYTRRQRWPGWRVYAGFTDSKFATATMISAYKRRWLQFSLLTMNVVVTLAAWLGWNLHQVRERERMLHQGGISYFSGFGSLRCMPLTWRLLGARAVYSIGLGSLYTDENLLLYRTAFPEADVSQEIRLPEVPRGKLMFPDPVSGRLTFIP